MPWKMGGGGGGWHKCLILHILLFESSMHSKIDIQSRFILWRFILYDKVRVIKIISEFWLDGTDRVKINGHTQAAI